MTDVESQMEANGLPTKFSSTADQPDIQHAVVNAEATNANSNISTSDLKSQVPSSLESSMLVEPVASTNTSVMKEPSVSDEIKMNGNTKTNGEGLSTNVNGHTPTAAHELSSVTQPESIATSSFGDSIPSSMPVTSSASTTALDISQTLPDSAQIDQAPVSNLRTVPHSDALTPEVVAKIEERKHLEDDKADMPPALEKKGSPVSPTSIPAPAPASIENTSRVASPPPPPEPAHATLAADVSVDEPVMPTVPAEKPVEPLPTPVIPTSEAQDAVMEDAPTTKLVREREEDDNSEPAAKRMRTDENTPTSDAADFKVPDAPSAGSAEPTNGVKVEGDDTVTIPRLNHMKKIISNLKKSNASTAFRLPVDYVALNIPNYPDMIRTPMDLGTIDQRLKSNSYTSVRAFIDDFETIVQNSILFNGREHAVTAAALKMQSSFNNQMQHLPTSTVVEPSKAEKKASKIKPEPVRTAPPRRPSVTNQSVAKSPKAAPAPSTATTPSFAPGPDGVPLIRRESSTIDGRPKRAIIPPKRNSDFAGVRPKKKKYELQLRFCQEVLKEIASTKHWQINQYFTHAVDPVALNIPTYFQIIKKPMDLGTIANKLDNNEYEKAKDFEEDVRLIFKNCYKFNPEGDFVNNLGHQLEDLFNKKWATKEDWIAAREPPSEPSEGGEEEDEEEASEEEEDSEDDRNEKIKALQAQIEAMSKQMGELTQSKKSKKKTPPTTTKKGGKASKPKKEKPTSTFPNLKPKDRKKPTSKTKAEKDRYVTFAEKQYISNGIAMLPERQMQEALKIIQNSVPALANSDQNEIELDIEEVPNQALLKLLNFVKKYAGPPPDEPEAKTVETYSAPSVPKNKKSKPMSKQEQEAQIEELKGKLGAYGGPGSPDAVQSVETGNDSSDDEADSEESEEE